MLLILLVLGVLWRKWTVKECNQERKKIGVTSHIYQAKLERSECQAFSIIKGASIGSNYQTSITLNDIFYVLRSQLNSHSIMTLNIPKGNPFHINFHTFHISGIVGSVLLLLLLLCSNENLCQIIINYSEFSISIVKSIWQNRSSSISLPSQKHSDF